jgi:hypothetical protein
MIVDIGGPPVIVKLILDTGSSEMWINPNCSASASPAACELSGKYKPELSGWAVPINRYFDFRYGTGFAKGQYYGDIVYIPGIYGQKPTHSIHELTSRKQIRIL